MNYGAVTEEKRVGGHMMIFRDRSLTIKQIASLLAFTIVVGAVVYLDRGRWLPVCTFSAIFCAIWLVRNLILHYIDGKHGLNEDADERTRSIAHQAAHSAFWTLMSIAFFFIWIPNGLLEYMDSFQLLIFLYSLGLVVYVFTEIRLRIGA